MLARLARIGSGSIGGPLTVGGIDPTKGASRPSDDLPGAGQRSIMPGGSTATDRP
jgi:hypothetical protein